jgi:hypothetical protein
MQTRPTSLSFSTCLVAAFSSVLVSKVLLGSALAGFDAQTKPGPVHLSAAASTTQV